jgi:C-terminal processing protease CtpA/Prc
MDQTDRLVRLIELWCAIRFFHPQLAYRKDIDWDAAFVSAVPNVISASDAPAYAAAINSMLAVLGDSATRVLPRRSAESPAASRAKVPFRRDLGGGINLISTAAFEDGDFASMIDGLRDFSRDLADTRGIIFDLRGSTLARSCFAHSGLETRLSTTPVTSPGQRERRHYAYAPLNGTKPGGYHSAFYVEDGTLYTPHRDARDVPCAFVIDRKTETPAIALALQQAERAAIICEGHPDDSALVETRTFELGDGFEAQLRLSELVYPDGAGGFAPDLVVADSSDDSAAIGAALAWLAHPAIKARVGTGLPASAAPAADRAYADMAYPSEEYRLLAAARIWGTINYFFPYKNLIGKSWTGVLREFIPRFRQAADATCYCLVAAEMAAKLNDTHCAARSIALLQTLGEAPPPVGIQRVEGQFVVTRLFDGAPPEIALGDIIIRVDGEDVAARAARLARYIAASTPQSLDWSISVWLLCGSDESIASIVIQKADGRTELIQLMRARSHWDRIESQRSGDVVAILPGNIGYVDLDRLQASAVDAMFEQLRDSVAIIFDMRGYPHGTGWAIAARMTDLKNVAGSLFETTIVTSEMIEAGDVLGGSITRTYLQRLPPTDKRRYHGRTFLLIDERALSQAEHTGLMLKAANATIFVGSPTAGANGDVTTFSAPGGINVFFTGQAIKHADGRQLQRVGLIPDIGARPTIAGIRAGRDEVLERALELANAQQV